MVECASVKNFGVSILGVWFSNKKRVMLNGALVKHTKNRNKESGMIAGFPDSRGTKLGPQKVILPCNGFKS
jgi:hypothetical protein